VADSRIVDDNSGVPVSGALVTNGRDVAVTDGEGFFSLPPNESYGGVTVCLPDDREMVDATNAAGVALRTRSSISFT